MPLAGGPGLLYNASDKEAKAAIELHLDRTDGPLIGTLPIANTSGEWKTVTASVTGAAGVHDLFLVFKGASGGDLFKLDWWKFE